ncbi:hypothetical protein [Rhizobium sp. P007]|nr:hypothetical protein [Rhizobium sp. P007]CAD7058311.1 hypothetical protein RP007_05846 [Rhizobium sp. P007]
MTDIVLPIRWIDHARKENADHFWGHPCVKASVGAVGKNPTLDPFSDINALVDSGCQMCMIDPAIPEHLGIKPHRFSVSRGNTGTIEGQRVFDIAIFFSEIGKVFSVEMMETPIHDGDPFSVILGRSFLLSWDIHLLAHPSVSKLVLP